VGLATLRRYASSDTFADLGNVAQRMPLVSAGLLTGLLSLAGFPLTGGFASRWPIYRLVYQENHFYAIALVLSGGAAALGCWRGLLALLGPNAHPELERKPIPLLRYLPTAAMMLILTLLCFMLGLFPQLLLPPILKLVEGFTFLGSLR
jgi:NADH-quinone oxidoreductase subunit N